MQKRMQYSWSSIQDFKISNSTSQKPLLESKLEKMLLLTLEPYPSANSCKFSQVLPVGKISNITSKYILKNTYNKTKQLQLIEHTNIPVNIYLLTIKTPEQRYWRCSGVFIVKFEHISHLFLVFLLLIVKKKMLAGMPPQIG